MYRPPYEEMRKYILTIARHRFTHYEVDASAYFELGWNSVAQKLWADYEDVVRGDVETMHRNELAHIVSCAIAEGDTPTSIVDVLGKKELSKILELPGYELLVELASVVIIAAICDLVCAEHPAYKDNPCVYM